MKLRHYGVIQISLLLLLLLLLYWETSFLFQRCSVLVQRFNAILLHDSLPAYDCTDWFFVPILLLLLLLLLLTKTSSWVDIRCELKCLGEVLWCTAMKAVVDEHTQTKLYSLRYSFSQWSLQRSGVVCAELLAENTNRAAALRTDCSRRCSVVDKATSTELQ